MIHKKKDILEILQTISCQHQPYASSMLCPAAHYLRRQWGAWARVLRKEYPGETPPMAHWHIATL
jgi:hypothetical protein